MELTPEQKDFLEGLETQLGVLNAALNRSNIDNETYLGWLNNPTFKKAVGQVNERTIDFVENQLLRKIGEGDLTAIQFYLKTKGKKRGY